MAKLRFIFLLGWLSPALVFSQVAFDGINFQGQLTGYSGGNILLEALIIDYSSDTIRREEFGSIALSDDGSFSFVLGSGTYLAGYVSQFSAINWYDVDKVELWRTDTGTPFLISSLSVNGTLPYAFYSLSVSEPPSVEDLSDYGGTNASGLVLKFDGLLFYPATDLTGDTAWYAINSYHSVDSDTATVGLWNPLWVDTSLISNLADTSNYAGDAGISAYADSSGVALYAGSAVFSLGNWAKAGNSGSLAPFVGSVSSQFIIRTNNQPRLNFASGDTVFNTAMYAGFGISSTSGALFQTNSSPGIQTIPGSFLYFDGAKSSLYGGESIYGLDTALKTGVISWGHNQAPNGSYVSSFGLNNRGDSSYIGGIWYAPNEFFCVGRNNVGSLSSVVIGDSAITDFTRNVAIGKNVFAGTSSANIAIGNNVVCHGSTSWAAGKNLNATGHFATLLGSNAGTLSWKGGFLFGDASSTTSVNHSANHQFMVRASGGYVFYSSADLSTGVTLDPGGGSWNMVSDRNKKENISLLNYSQLGDKIRLMPLFYWTYSGQNLLHVGPMAQDFSLNFNYGESSQYINMLDIDAVVFGGIKYLNNKLDSLKFEDNWKNLNSGLEQEKVALDSLTNRIELLYEKLDN